MVRDIHASQWNLLRGLYTLRLIVFFFFQAEDGIRDDLVTGVQTCALPISASPTAIALAPIAGKHLNYYLDSTSANLGVTQLTRPLAFDYSFDNVSGPFLDRKSVV